MLYQLNTKGSWCSFLERMCRIVRILQLYDVVIYVSWGAHLSYVLGGWRAGASYLVASKWAFLGVIMYFSLKPCSLFNDMVISCVWGGMEYVMKWCSLGRFLGWAHVLGLLRVYSVVFSLSDRCQAHHWENAHAHTYMYYTVLAHSKCWVKDNLLF